MPSWALSWTADMPFECVAMSHLWVSESELDGKVTNTKIGVLQVWLKQDSSWKLLARASFKLPEPVEKS
jgi:hypothetical protein